jgi:hypothetical protein
VNKLGSQLDASGLGLARVSTIGTQFEFDKTKSKSTQNILTGTGVENTMAVGGQTTRISTNITSQGNNDFRGYKYGTQVPE